MSKHLARAGIESNSICSYDILKDKTSPLRIGRLVQPRVQPRKAARHDPCFSLNGVGYSQLSARLSQPEGHQGQSVNLHPLISNYFSPEMIRLVRVESTRVRRADRRSGRSTDDSARVVSNPRKIPKEFLITR